LDAWIREANVEKYRPISRLLRTIDQIPLKPRTVVSAKLDGEYQLVMRLNFMGGKVIALNRFGHLRTDLPPLRELEDRIPEGMRFLGELYAIDVDRPLRLPEYISIIKSGDKARIERHIRLMLFDIVGLPAERDYLWRLEEIKQLLNDRPSTYVHPPIYITPTTHQEIQDFWNHYVETLGYEGLMVWSENQFYKLKRRREVDGVIIGLNKDTDSWQEGQVGSVKIAVMTAEGYHIPLCDVGSGIDPDLRKALTKLMRLKTDEDAKTVWVKPAVIVTVEYTETFENETMLLTFRDGHWTPVRKTKFHSLRHPRFICFRKDKKPTYEDIRAEQL